MRSLRRAPATVLALSAGLLGTATFLVQPAGAQTAVATASAGALTGASITTVAGTGTAGSSGDNGVAVAAELSTPSGVAEDAAGSLYIADTFNNKVRKVVAPQTQHQDLISTIAGTGSFGFAGDGGPAIAAVLAGPSGVAVDGVGDVFIADTGNNVVRKVSPTGIMSTYAGTGICAFSRNIGNGGWARGASLCLPTGLALDAQGDLFVSDTGHNVVREVTPDGKIRAFAGNGGYGVCGTELPALKVQLFGPAGLGTDHFGDVFIADTGNSKILEVTPNGKLKTFAGTGALGFKGDGGRAVHAKLAGPSAVSVSPTGDVYLTDSGNARIRKVDGQGIITTVAGTGLPGFVGDGGSPLTAELDRPTGIAANDGDAVYFADTSNERVRGIFNGPPPVLPQSPLGILLPVTGAVVVLGFVAIRRRRRDLVA